MEAKFRTLISTSDNNFVEVIKHSVWALLILIGATGIQFIFDLLLTRTFNASGSGLFYLGLSVMMSAALLGRLGLDRSVIRFIPPLLAKGKIADARGVKRASLQLALYITIPLALIIFIFSEFIANNIFHEPEIETYLKIFAFAVPPFTINYIYSGILRSAKLTREALLVERVVIYALGILSVLVLGSVYGLQGVVIGFVCSCYISAALGFRLSSKPLGKTAINSFSKKKLLTTALPLLFVVFATQMSGQVSVLLLGAFGNTSDVGIFNIALKISLLITLILTAINTINATKISELYADNRKRQLELLLSKTSALGLVAALPLFLIMLLVPQLLLALFGSEFIAGSSALMILALGQFVNVSVGSTLYTLAMTGREKSLAIAVGLSLVLNVILGVVLIPSFGIIGASIATALAIAFSNIALLLLVKHYLGIWTLPFKSLKVWMGKLT